MPDYPINLLETVTTASELRENIRRFHRDIDQNYDRSVSLARQTKYWTYDPKSKLFGPGKFIGYKRMNFERYDYPRANYTEGDSFDGSTTRAAVEAIAGEFFESPKLNDELYAWMESKFGDAVANVTRSKWRFVDLTLDSKCWAVACDPRRYNIEGALEVLDEISWESFGKDITKGDRVVIWKLTGDAKNGRRGIVGLGEISIDAFPFAESPDELAFYVGKPETEVALRTRFRVLPTSNVPIWLSENEQLLKPLKVARAYGGTWFSVSELEWQKIAELAALESVPDEEDEPGKGGGQGFNISTPDKDAIEARAMNVAEDHFLRIGYEVFDECGGNPYDLRCVRGDEVLFVEVKGMKGTGNRIFVTRNEVKLSQKNPAAMALAVVRNIVLNREGEKPVGEGGDLEIRQPWNVDDCELVPLEYECFLPGSPR